MAEVSAYAGEGTENIDLDGRTMVPGFFDSHGHVVMGGLHVTCLPEEALEHCDAVVVGEGELCWRDVWTVIRLYLSMSKR